MTRRILMTAVLGVLAAGIGCKHVGGKCDCGAHPGDAIVQPPTPPYPTAPAPGTAPANPIPPATPTNGAGAGTKVETKSIPGTLPIPMAPKN